MPRKEIKPINDRLGVVEYLVQQEELREHLGLRLVVLHFNHQLRGAEADADEQFVAQLADKLGLALISAREVTTAVSP